MNLLSQKVFYIFSFLICFLSTWVIIGAIPSLQLDGMFKQVDTQIFLLHIIFGTFHYQGQSFRNRLGRSNDAFRRSGQRGQADLKANESNSRNREAFDHNVHEESFLVW